MKKRRNKIMKNCEIINNVAYLDSIASGEPLTCSQQARDWSEALHKKGVELLYIKTNNNAYYIQTYGMPIVATSERDFLCAWDELENATGLPTERIEDVVNNDSEKGVEQVNAIAISEEQAIRVAENLKNENVHDDSQHVDAEKAVVIEAQKKLIQLSYESMLFTDEDILRKIIREELIAAFSGLSIDVSIRK